MILFFKKLLMYEIRYLWPSSHMECIHFNCPMKGSLTQWAGPSLQEEVWAQPICVQPIMAHKSTNKNSNNSWIWFLGGVWETEGNSERNSTKLNSHRKRTYSVHIGGRHGLYGYTLTLISSPLSTAISTVLLMGYTVWRKSYQNTYMKTCTAQSLERLPSPVTPLMEEFMATHSIPSWPVLFKVFKNITFFTSVWVIQKTWCVHIVFWTNEFSQSHVGYDKSQHLQFFFWKGGKYWWYEKWKRL